MNKKMRMKFEENDSRIIIIWYLLATSKEIFAFLRRIFSHYTHSLKNEHLRMVTTTKGIKLKMIPENKQFDIKELIEWVVVV